MATAELVVAFDARTSALEVSLKRVDRQLKDLQQTVSSSGSAVSENTSRMARAFDDAGESLKRFVVAYASLRGLQGFSQGAVAVNELNASIQRLGILTNTSVGGAVDQFTRLQSIATATGQPVTELTNLFTRFYTATASLGASRQQVEQFVESLATFSRLSAQSPQETAAALTQLSQGLASGRLQGDELKSILENMPLLATALAQELGVTVGELRKMGEEGKLVADNVFPAIIRAGARIQEQLNGVPLTLRQAFQVFADSALAAIARVDRAWGATEWGSEVIARLGRRADAVSRMRQGTGPEVAPEDRTMNISARLAELARIQNEAERFLNTPRTPPTGPLRFLQQFNPEEGVAEARERLASANREALELQRTQRQVLDTIAERNRLEAEQREREGRDQRIQSAEATAQTIRESANPIAKAERERDDRLRDLRRTLADRRARDEQTGDRAAAAATDRFAREQEAAIQRIFAREKEQAEAGSRAAATAAQRAQERQDRQDNSLALRQARERRQALEVVRGADRGTTRDIDALFERLTTPAVGSTVGSPIQVALQQSIQLTEIFGALETQVTATGTATQRAGGDMNDVLAAATRNANLLRDALIAERPQDAGIIGQQTDAAIERMRVSLERVAAAAKDTWNAIGVQGVQTFAQDLAGGIIDFVDTGVQKFDELAANFAKNIAKMILQAQILNALRAGLGPGGLNLLTFRAEGGPVSAGQPYIVGERQPELFVPGSSGYIFPSVPSGGGGTTVNVYNQASGTTTRQQERSNGLGGKEIDIYIEQVVQKGMARGRYDGVMGQSFGASRRGSV